MKRKPFMLVLVLMLGALSGCVHSHVIDNKNSYEPVQFNTLHSADTPLQGGPSDQAEPNKRWWQRK